MLDAGGHGGGIGRAALITVNHGLGHARVQVGVFTAAFGDTAPAGVAGDVQHGREGPADTLCGGFDGRHAGALFHQGGIKSGRQPQRDGENGMITMDDVAAHQQRDSQTGFLHGDALQLVDLRGIHLVEDGADLSVTEGLGVIGDGAAGGDLVHLADLLGQGHLREQLLHARFNGRVGTYG